jgi:hypothetical protein
MAGPGLDDFRMSVARGQRLARRHEEAQAGVYQAWLDEQRKLAAERLLATAVTAGGAMPNPDEIYPLDKASARLHASSEPGRVAMVQDTVHGVSALYGASFDVTNPLIANLLTKMGQKITHIAEWQRAGIMNAVQHGYDQGYSVVRMAELMTDPSTGINSMRRAAMIARTELTQATQGASLAAAQTVDVAKFKQWLAAIDSRTRHDHSMVSGDVAKLHEKFNVNGHPMDHPGDPVAPAKEVVHCRCVLVYTDNPEGLAGVPKHDQIQAAASNPEVIADDQRWLRRHRSELARPEKQRQAQLDALERAAAEREKLNTPGIHHRGDLSPDDSFTYHGSSAHHYENVGNTGRHADIPEYRPNGGSEFVLTTRHGQQIKVFHEHRKDLGVEIPETIRQASMMRRLEELRAQLDELPRKVAADIRLIRMMNDRNPGDAYWTAMRGRGDFQAVATGGDGHISWWGGRKSDYGVLAHEAGHTISGDYRYTIQGARGIDDLGLPPTWWDQPEVWGGPPDGDKWLALARADSKHRGSLWTESAPGSWQEDLSGQFVDWIPAVKDGHRITQTGGAVTSYGADSMAEDFAESVRLWALDRKHGYLGISSDGTRIRFKDLFPRRAGYLSRLLGGK